MVFAHTSPYARYRNNTPTEPNWVMNATNQCLRCRQCRSQCIMVAADNVSCERCRKYLFPCEKYLLVADGLAATNHNHTTILVWIKEVIAPQWRTYEPSEIELGLHTIGIVHAAIIFPRGNVTINQWWRWWWRQRRQPTTTIMMKQ